MGRLPLMETDQTSYPPPPYPVEAQPQAPTFPPQLNIPPQQFYNLQQPQHATINANFQYPNHYQQTQSLQGCPLQYHQSCTSPMAAQNGNNNCVTVTPPFHSTFQNSAAPATGTPIQIMPVSSPQPVVHLAPWTTGLFDCMDDPTNALTTAVFPCVTFGQIADVLDGGHTNCGTSGIVYASAPCLVSRPYRTKLRRLFGLVEAPTADWIVHSVFEPCALCQAYRELNNRGIHPALGYHGNLEKLAIVQDPSMVPPKNQIMN